MSWLRRSLLFERIGPGSLRYLLALTVVFFHATRYVPLGHTAVYLFFVLSGYWMSRTYERTYSKTANALGTYAISRIWRIVPLYLVILALTLAGYAAYQSLTGRPVGDALQRVQTDSVLLRNLVIFGLHDYDHKLIVPAWSLDVELRFYAVLPLLAAWRARSGGRVLLGASVISVAALGARIWSGLPGYGLEYLVAFAAGMALDRGSRTPLFSPGQVTVANALAGCVLLLPYVVGTYGDAIFWHREIAWHGVELWEAHNVVLAILLVPFVEHNVRRPSSATDHRLGHGAYALYLVHWGLLGLYAAQFGNAGGTTKALGSALYVAAACTGAWALERFVDRASETYRRRWLAGRALSQSVASQPHSLLGS